MFEDSHNTDFDLLMKSILESGQEEVPERVWGGISEELDNLARRKKAALWWRRAAIGSAAAAVVAVGMFLGFNGPQTHQDDSTMIAVIPPVRESDGNVTLANAEEQPAEQMEVRSCFVPRSAAEFETAIDEVAADAGQAQPVHDKSEQDRSEQDKPENQGPSEMKKADEGRGRNQEASKGQSTQGSLKLEDNWKETPEDGDFKADNSRASVVISGITGTNSTRSKARHNLMKRPTVPSTKPRTGITETSTNTTYGIPVSFGAGVKVDITERWAVGAGLNYTLLTRKFYGTYTKATEDGIIEISQSSDIRNAQHYIGIPVNAYFNILNNRHVNFYAYAGGTAEKCISDRYEVLNVNGSPIIHKEKAKGIQLSANVGIGVEFMIGKYVGLYVDPSLRYYFDNGQPKSIRTAQPLMLGFEMGIRARL